MSHADFGHEAGEPFGFAPLPGQLLDGVEAVDRGSVGLVVPALDLGQGRPLVDGDGVLRAIFNAAVEAELIWRSPCRGIKLPAVQPNERYIVDGDELAALAAAMGDDYGPIAYLGAALGLRWGECAGLKAGRLDFLRSTLTVAMQRTRGPGGEMVEGPPKSAAGPRTLAVPAPLMEMLSRHLARRKLTRAHVDAYVFTAPEGGPLDYSHFRDRVWVPACNATGLKGLRFHDLRHANATGLVADGVDVKTAQTRLGHSDPRLTLAIYAQAVTDADRAAADKLGARFMRPCGMDVGFSARNATPRRRENAPDQGVYGVDLGCHYANTPAVSQPSIRLAAPNAVLRHGDGDR